MAESQRRREPPAALGLVVTALALVAVVAIVSRAHRSPGGSGHSHTPSAALVDDLLSVAVIVFLVAAVVYVRLLHLRRRATTQSARRRHELISLLVFLALVALLVVIVQRRGLVERSQSPPPLQQAPLTTPQKPAKPKPAAATRYEPSFRWLPFAIAGGLLLAGAGVFLLVRARRRARLGPLGELSLEQALALVLDDALDDLRRERDVRRAIVAAYARMERLLAAHGLGRAAWEAPLEYLDRVLVDLSASRGSVARLTRLFVRAKFSRQVLGEEAKDEAIGALQTLRIELGGAG